MKVRYDARFPGGGVRDIVVIVDEATDNECTENAHQMVWTADITDETTPRSSRATTFARSRAVLLARRRFGAHSCNENMTPIYYQKVVFVSYFNAACGRGHPQSRSRRGSLSLHPETTENTDVRCITVNGQERCKTAMRMSPPR